MRFVLLAILSAVAVLALGAGADEGGEEPNVATLTFANFMDTLENNEYVLVHFYAPWSVHCKQLAPKFEAAAAQLQDEKVDFLFAKVDGIEEVMLKGFNNIQRFPTMKFFQKGHAPMEYDGGRSQGELHRWALAAVAAGKNGKSVKEAMQAAKNRAAKTANFARVMDSLPPLPKGVKEFYNRRNEAAVGKRDEKRPTAPTPHGSAPARSVPAAVDDGLPPVLSFPSRTLLRLLDREISIKGDSQIVFLVWKAESDDSAELGKRFDALAKAHRGRSLFIGIDAEDSAAMKYFKIPRTELPAARAINYVGTEMRYKLSVPSLEESVGQFLDGNVPEPYYTAPMVEKWTSAKSAKADTATWFDAKTDGIVSVTGDSFQADVMSTAEDVVLMVYADWCEHCKTLKPKFLNLAARLRGVSTLRFAAMNGDTNEVHGLDVQAFPEVYLFKALDKDSGAHEYVGPRTEEGILQFVQDKASHMFTIPDGAHEEL